MDETQATALNLEEAEAVIAAGGAGGRVIRGGTLRAGGYLVGTIAATAASVVLLRYLGVVDVGRYVTVMSLLAVAGGLADAGLTVIGQREYTVAGSAAQRRDVLGDVLAVRLVLTPLAVLAAALFAVIAGYDGTMVLGTLVGGIGIVIAAATTTMTVPLSTRLRLGAVTAIEVMRQVVTAAALATLALAGAALLPFFAVGILSGLAALALALVLVGAAGRVPPRFAPGEWRPLIVEAAPVALALAASVLYVRGLVVLTSLLASARQTGYFATSFRLLEAFAAVSVLMIGSAVPVLAHAAEADQERLASGLRRVAQVMLLVVLGIVLALVFGARPIVRLLAGPGYGPAARVLQIQAFALIGGFMTQVWVTGLVAVRGQRALVVTNALALGAVVVFGFALIPPLGARGAALASVAGEAVLCLATLLMLVRGRPELRPGWDWVLRITGAGAAGALCGLLAPVADAGAALIAVVVFAAAALALGAVPRELLTALVRRPGVQGR
jgi:O-antigen/teichoic acid export membrane protein